MHLNYLPCLTIVQGYRFLVRGRDTNFYGRHILPLYVVSVFSLGILIYICEETRDSNNVYLVEAPSYLPLVIMRMIHCGCLCPGPLEVSPAPRAGAGGREGRTARHY
jgi:hypothetical protein